MKQIAWKIIQLEKKSREGENSLNLLTSVGLEQNPTPPLKLLNENFWRRGNKLDFLVKKFL